MERVARVIVRHPRRVLVLTALITLAAILALLRIEFNADVASFITEGNERGEEFAALQEKYDTSDPVNLVLSLPEGEDFTDREHLAGLTRYRDRLAQVEGVRAVAALIPERNLFDGSAITPEMVEGAPKALLDTLTRGEFAELLLSDDGRHTMVVVVPEGDGIAVARAIPDVPAPDDARVTVAGNPAIYASVIDLLSLFLLLIPPVVLVLLLVTFFANVGSRRLTILAVIPAILGSLWTFGLISGLGIAIDIVTVIVPIFVLVMGSADGLHFVTHFQDVSAETEDPLQRVVSTLREVGVPMILTTVSTSVGFLSLLATDIRPLRQLGLFAAVGITFAGIISFFSLPAAMSHLRVGDERVSPLLGRRVPELIKRLVLARWPALLLTTAVIVFGAIYVPRLVVDSDPLFMFTEDHEVRVAFDTTRRLFGGATPLVGEFVFDPGAPEESLEEAAAASEQLESMPGVESVFSLADMTESLPPQAITAILDGMVELPVGDLVSEDGLRFLLLPGEFDTDDLRGWLEFAESSDSVRVLTGLPVLWDEMARLVLGAQVWSVVTALGLVAIMLFIAYRRIRPTLVALIPLLLTVVALLGFIAASGIQLNMITAVASSIVIGVGIDYAIHFVAAVDHARAGGPGFVLRAIDRSGRPIVANALGIAIALTALLLSPLRPHHHISGIMWVSMTVAALSALLVIPALLSREGIQSNH
jgi:predicted RND superfamily exporter protein